MSVESKAGVEFELRAESKLGVEFMLGLELKSGELTCAFRSFTVFT